MAIMKFICIDCDNTFTQRVACVNKCPKCKSRNTMSYIGYKRYIRNRNKRILK